MPPNEFNVQAPPVHDINDMINDGLSGGGGATLQFPEDRTKYYTTLNFFSYSFSTGTGSSPRETGGSSIILPLPVNLVDKHTVRYDEKPMVPWASAASAAIGYPVQIVGAFVGLAPNWYQTIMFDRPEYKRHELAFKLSPRNFEEARQIQQIITTINNAMAPSIFGGGTAVLFNFPDLVRVTLRPNAGFLYKFKPAVVEHFVINYVGGGNKAFYHGPGTQNPPESVEITMVILETEYWLKGQFNTSDQ